MTHYYPYHKATRLYRVTFVDRQSNTPFGPITVRALSYKEAVELALGTLVSCMPDKAPKRQLISTQVEKLED